MKRMRIRLVLIISLIIGVIIVSYAFALYQVRSQQRSLKHEIEKRSELLAESMDVSIQPLVELGYVRELRRLIEGFGKRMRLVAVVVYNDRGQIEAANSGLPAQLKTVPPPVDRAIARNNAAGSFMTLNHKLMHVYALPLHRGAHLDGVLTVFTDASDLGAASASMWRQTFLRILVELLIIVAITFFVLRWAMAGRIRQMADWMHELRAGNEPGKPLLPDQDLFKPLVHEVAHLTRSLTAARAHAEEEARLREAGESVWTSERLRIFVQSKLEDSRLFAVSNREPYEHVRQGREIACVVPASGLVTALEPILRACDGTWVAHGAGEADRETVDKNDRLRVPPEDPHYTLRRVWLSKEEIEGYYFGFANEGLWPLCHIAHARPTFRTDDWTQYHEVNQKFASAVLEEMEDEERPMVLAQDYHFALLPRMVKDRRPSSRVAIFWHIPWPNPEAFGICPWQRELLEGLLGADLIGFHTQSHCNNFLETVDRALESRTDWDRFAVNRAGHLTLVRPFPISVDFRENGAHAPAPGSLYLERSALLREHGVEAAFMGVGVDRVDYTKGIIERFHGIERFLERYPAYKGRFAFVQIGAPSRTHIKRYHDLQVDVESEVDRINWKFQTPSWRPIIYLKRLHTHHEIERYYRAADLCMVTSLHDGMNLVAKEFVVSRDDEQGALILSRFTGAARELRDALIVNPYDTEQLAGAIYFALEMEPEERSARMKRMRRAVREHNIYRWAATLVGELADVRAERPSPVRAPKISRPAV